MGQLVFCGNFHTTLQRFITFVKEKDTNYFLSIDVGFAGRLVEDF